MSGSIEDCLNKASESEIADHLLCCDAEFVPPLSGRVEISAYAKKIASKAIRFEAWAEGVLVGLLVVYCNDRERQSAYITSVSVLREWMRRGIASDLIEQCIEHVKELGFGRIELEVDSENVGAIKLYREKGFKMNMMDGRSTIMYLNKKKGA